VSVPAYPAYKDSGVEWLGDVPADWSVHRIADIYREVAEPGTDDLPILSVSIHHGVSDSEAGPDEEERKVTRSDDRSKYKQVRPNDLVYNMMRAWQGGFGAVQVFGMVSPAYVVARPRQDLPSSFVELILRTSGAVEEMRRRSRGVTDFRLRLYWDEFKDMRIALPSAHERAAILAFLDRETVKIDALVEEQRRLIALLKEKRQAVISHAITKGLDPNAPMKNSGIEWLGEVPAHWEVRRIGQLANVIQTGPFGSQLHAEDYIVGGVPVINPANLNAGKIVSNDKITVSLDLADNLAPYKMTVGDIVIGRRGEMGRCAVVSDAEDGWICGTGSMIIRINSAYDSNFIANAIGTEFIVEKLKLASVGSTMDNLNAAIVARISLPVPCLEEQRAILAYIAGAVRVFDRLSEQAERATSLLQERRAALISAAVTGKIDVRGLVPEQAEAA
jgi:type I restriction enzyme S subunit